ncbi:hypothetical protein MRX96_004731 [Rhipicephalus microplus]
MEGVLPCTVCSDASSRQRLRACPPHRVETRLISPVRRGVRWEPDESAGVPECACGQIESAECTACVCKPFCWRYSQLQSRVLQGTAAPGGSSGTSFQHRCTSAVAPD